MTDAEDLPDGWAVAILGEVTEPKVQQGGPSDASSTFTYIDITGVDNGRKAITDPKAVPVKDAPSRARQHVRPGDVLVSMTRPNLNAVAVVPENLAGSIASTGFHVLRPKEVLPEWLFMIVRSTAFVTAMSELVQGALYPAVRPSDIRDFTIPIPPLAEQRRIVAKVEELTARSRAARAALAEVPTLLEQFRQSVLASAFRGDLTADWRAKNPTAEPASVLLDRIRAERRKQWETKYPKKKYVAPEPVDDSDLPELPEGWEYARADEIVATGTVITYGIVLPGDPVDGGVPYVRGQDIEDGRILVEQLARTTPEIAARHDRSSLQQGDVLLCIIRHLKVAIVPTGIDGANLTQGTVRLRPSEVILGQYLAGYLAGPTAQAWMKKRYFGMAMPRINVEDARAIPIPIAPIEEQREIIRHIDASERCRATALAEVTQALDESGGLDQSILAKAFRGELVPQDPADEPAAALLARIRSGVSATRSVERGRVKFYILLLLRTWKKPLSREMLERGLVLMLNADVRRAIIGRSKPAPKRGKKPGTPPRFVAGLYLFLGEMLDDGDLVPGPEVGFFAEGQHGIDFAAAPKADLDAVRETAEAMKVIHKDKLQATDADIVSALHGEIYELVS